MSTTYNHFFFKIERDKFFGSEAETRDPIIFDMMSVYVNVIKVKIGSFSKY